LQFCKLLKFPSIGKFAINKNGQIIAIFQIAIIKTAKLLQFCQLLKSLLGIFAIYENGQIIAILQIVIIKNDQIIAILQIIKIPLYRECFAIYKTAKYLQFCKLQFIYKNGEIIEILNIAIYKKRPNY
jgi:hypothetical protein